MALTSQGRPARKRSVHGHNTDTAVNSVYICPPNCTAEVNYILVANGASSGNNSVTVQWYVLADTYTSHFLSDKSLAHDQYHEFPQIQLVLSPGDEIQVQTSHAGHIDSIITVTETFVPNA